MSRRADDRSPRRVSDPRECSIDSVDPVAVSAARAAALTERDSSAITTMFDALSDPTRLTILHALMQTELCVCDLAEVCGISQSGVSHQLRVLRDRDLVTSRRDGKRAVYRLADDHVRDLVAVAVEHVREPPGAR